MVRHQTVRQPSNRKALYRRNHDSFKCDIVFRFGKQFVSSVPPIQGVINEFSRNYARSPRHRGTLYMNGANFVKKKVRIPFLPPPPAVHLFPRALKKLSRPHLTAPRLEIKRNVKQ